MSLRSLATTLALAVGLFMILLLAFVMCICAYVVNWVTLQQPRARLAPTLPAAGQVRD